MAVCLDLNIALARHNPEYFRTGLNLSVADRAVIKPEDTWKVSLIDNLLPADQEAADACLRPLHPPHYLGVQRKDWLIKEKYFTELRERAAITEAHLLEVAKEHRNLVRYRLCYTLNFPFWVALNTAPYARRRDIVDAFLAMAEAVHPRHYPYYTALSACNRLGRNGGA